MGTDRTDRGEMTYGEIRDVMEGAIGGAFPGRVERVVKEVKEEVKEEVVEDEKVEEEKEEEVVVKDLRRKKEGGGQYRILKFTMAQKLAYNEWYALSEEEKGKRGLPENDRQYCVAHNLWPATVGRWRKELEVQSPEAKVLAFKERLYELAMEGKNAQFAHLYARMEKLIEEKTMEVRVGLTADEITRRNLQAERELREFREGGHRVEEVSEESGVLPK